MQKMCHRNARRSLRHNQWSRRQGYFGILLELELHEAGPDYRVRAWYWARLPLNEKVCDIEHILSLQDRGTEAYAPNAWLVKVKLCKNDIASMQIATHMNI